MENAPCSQRAMNLHNNTWPYFDRPQWLAQGILETKQ